MKKTAKGFLLGSLVTILLTSSAIGSSIQSNINVLFNSIKITVNDELISADNILYKGTTYVPIRSVAEILGKEVTWNPKTKTAGIKDFSTSKKVKSKNEVNEILKNLNKGEVTYQSSEDKFISGELCYETNIVWMSGNRTRMFWVGSESLNVYDYDDDNKGSIYEFTNFDSL